jgi:hypothetical protein
MDTDKIGTTMNSAADTVGLHIGECALSIEEMDADTIDRLIVHLQLAATELAIKKRRGQRKNEH